MGLRHIIHGVDGGYPSKMLWLFSIFGRGDTTWLLRFVLFLQPVLPIFLTIIVALCKVHNRVQIVGHSRESARITHHNAGACPRVRGAGRRRSRPRERPPERHSAGPGGQGAPPSGCDRQVVPESASRASLRLLAVVRAGPRVRPRASRVYRNHTELPELGAWFSRKPAGRPSGCDWCGNPGDSLLASGRAKRKQHHTKFFRQKKCAWSIPLQDDAIQSESVTRKPRGNELFRSARLNRPGRPSHRGWFGTNHGAGHVHANTTRRCTKK